MSSALDRLNSSNMMPDVSDYSIDEQLQSASEDDAQFLSDMSPEARQGFINSTTVQEVTMDDEPEEEPTEEPEPAKENDLFNNKKQRKTYKRKTDANSGEWDPLLNQLSKDIIKDLKEKGYTVGNFNADLTKKILNYMLSKF